MVCMYVFGRFNVLWCDIFYELQWCCNNLKYVTPKAVVQGNPKLNVAYVANLFNNHPGLEPLSEEEKAALDEWLFRSEGDREARGKFFIVNTSCRTILIVR